MPTPELMCDATKDRLNVSACLTNYAETASGGCRSGMLNQNLSRPLCQSQRELRKLHNVSFGLNTMNENQVCKHISIIGHCRVNRSKPFSSIKKLAASPHVTRPFTK